MAKITKKRARVVKTTGMSGAGVDSTISLLDIGKRFTKEYARAVIEQRALPDYRDGLKPVQRRILWAARSMGLRYNEPHRKAARLVGDTIGKFHPHGDSSIYDAMVNMEKQHMPVGLMDGQGNWGTVTDNAAAYRYTEVRPSQFADLCVMPKEYMPVTEYVPNFDGTEREPVFMPALMPVLLMNGVFGIAVGVSCGIPPLHIDSLMPLIRARIEGKTIGPKLMKKHLRFNYRYSPNCTSVDDDIIHWINTGTGGIIFSPEYRLDEDRRLLTITNVPPFFNWELVVKRLGQPKFAKILSGVDDRTSKATKNWPVFEVKFKSSIDKDDLADVAAPVIKTFDITVRNACNVTKRYINTQEEVAEADFDGMTPLNLINQWTDYRIDLERRFQTHRIGIIDHSIFRNETLIFARANIDKVIRIIRESTDPKAALIAKLKMTAEQAEIIVKITLGQLSRLNEQEVQADIKKLKGQRKEAVSFQKNPGDKALVEMNSLVKSCQTPPIPYKI